MEYCVVFVWASKWHNPCESSCRVRLCVSLHSQRFNQKTELKVRLMATWVCLKMGYTRQIPIHMLIRKMTVKHGPDDRNLLLPCCCFRGVKLSPLSSYDLSFLRPLNRKLMQRVDHGLCLLPHWLPVVIKVAIAYSIVEKTTIQVFLEGITDQEIPIHMNQCCT